MAKDGRKGLAAMKSSDLTADSMDKIGSPRAFAFDKARMYVRKGQKPEDALRSVGLPVTPQNMYELTGKRSTEPAKHFDKYAQMAAKYNLNEDFTLEEFNEFTGNVRNKFAFIEAIEKERGQSVAAATKLILDRKPLKLIDKNILDIIAKYAILKRENDLGNFINLYLEKVNNPDPIIEETESTKNLLALGFKPSTENDWRLEGSDATKLGGIQGLLQKGFKRIPSVTKDELAGPDGLKWVYRSEDKPVARITLKLVEETKKSPYRIKNNNVKEEVEKNTISDLDMLNIINQKFGWGVRNIAKELFDTNFDDDTMLKFNVFSLELIKDLAELLNRKDVSTKIKEFLDS